MREKYIQPIVIMVLCACISLWVWRWDNLRDDKQTLETELSICQSYLEDACSAIDSDKDNFRISCKDIKDANDYGRGL